MHNIIYLNTEQT